MTNHNRPHNQTFDHFDPLTGLRDLTELDKELQPEATDAWFEVFSPWINSVARKARLEHSNCLQDDTIDHAVRKMVIRIVTDCQNHPAKVQYVGSLELAVLEEVRNEVPDVQRKHGMTVSKPKSVVTRGSALDNLGHDLASAKGRAPTRAEVVTEWYRRRDK
ncbi:MAG: hypothetical protein HLX51_00735 [Micrococcaceae bacterium]|nr:hypothetical protein [Micrococcaceae bacterium]